MFKNELSIRNFQNISLGKLPSELLIVVSDVNLHIMARNRQVCKGLKILIDETKLIERILSTDKPAVKKLLQNFYSFSPSSLMPFTDSLYRSVKSGFPYSYVFKLLDSFENDKILFIKELDKEFRSISPYSEKPDFNPILVKLLLFVNDPRKEVSAEAQRLLLELVIDGQLTEKQKWWIKDSVDISKWVSQFLCMSIVSLAFDFIIGSKVVYVYYALSILIPSIIMVVIERISKYTIYGGINAHDQNVIGFSVALGIAILRNLLF